VPDLDGFAERGVTVRPGNFDDPALLRNATYADLLLGPAAVALAAGKLVTNEGDGRTSYVARGDCAAVLTSDSIDHDYRTYDVTGPAALAPADLAAIYAELGGRPVEPVLVDDDSYVARLVERASVDEDTARLYAT
jgi:NAD(P)H dehydrogenase (quinone)